MKKQTKIEIDPNRKIIGYDPIFIPLGLDVLNMILLTEIRNLAKLKKGCIASDEYFGVLIRIGEKNAGERIKYIERLGYIKCETKFENKIRTRRIYFLLTEVNPPQGELTTKRIRKIKKGKPPQGGFTEPPQGGFTKKSKKLVEVPQIPQDELNSMGIDEKGKPPQGGNILQVSDADKLSSIPDRIVNPTPSRGEQSEAGPKGPEEIKIPTSPILTIAGPENKLVDDSIIHFPSSTDYGKMKDGPDNNIPTSIPGPKNTNNIPEFLQKGIMFGGETYYPFNIMMKSGMQTFAEARQNRIIANEIVKIINKQVNSEEKLYNKNKNVIINLAFLSKHKDELQGRDEENFMNYLTSIKSELTQGQKHTIKPNAEVIRRYINEKPEYKKAIKNIKLAFGI